MDSRAPKAPDLHPARSPRYDRLAPADCARLHDASLSILERTGVRLHDEEAVERLHGAGARVGDDGRVFVPGPLVEWALSVAPRSLTLHARGGAPAIALDGDNAWFGAGAKVLDGVKIGAHSIIGTGAVVTKDIPEYSIAIGLPAKVIRDRRTAKTT